VLLMVIIFAVILASGADDDEVDGEETLAFDVDTTATAETVETPEPDPEPAATPTPEPTPEPEDSDAGDDSDEITMTPTPTPTLETVAEEPPPEEPTPVPQQPDPTPEPIVGEFGELPPGDMPSGSPAEALNLQFNLDMSLQAVPSQATVYQIQRRQWTLEDVQNLASRLEIDAEVVDQGNGSFRAEGASASIYISPNSVQYIRPSAPDTVPELPGNDQLIEMARNWLTSNGLVGADVGTGQVLDRDAGSGRAFVQLKPVDPPSIISATPSAGVTVRGDGVVVEATLNWPASLYGSTYSLRSAEDLWADATQGRSFIEINVNDLPANFQGAGATATITNASVSYTIAGNPQGTQYLVPVVVFSGTATIEGGASPVPIRLYVQAAAAQAIPRG
jgi:hypothetical protein